MPSQEPKDGGDSGGFTWSQILSVAPDEVEAFLRSPTGFITGVILASLLTAWETLLSSLRSSALAVIDSLEAGVREPLVSIGNAASSTFLGSWTWMVATITDAATAAGFAAPIALAIGWIVPALFLAVGFNLLIGLLDEVPAIPARETVESLSGLVSGWFR